MSTKSEEVRHCKISEEDIKRIKDEVVAEMSKQLPKILLDIFLTLVNPILPTIITTVENRAVSQLDDKKIVKDQDPERLNKGMLKRKKAF